jgi:nanoRNase/pAp phosphatase (c-di-AMP/oligoRNAs hydrolase)
MELRMTKKSIVIYHGNCADGFAAARSQNGDTGIDVAEVAKQYGGGGHRHAAGFSVPRTHALALI